MTLSKPVRLESEFANTRLRSACLVLIALWILLSSSRQRLSGPLKRTVRR